MTTATESPGEEARAAKAVPVSRKRPPVITVVVVFSIVGLLHAYMGWRLIPGLQLSLACNAALIVLLALSTLLIPLSLLVPFLAGKLSKRSASVLAWAGLLAMGCFSSMLILTLLRDALLLSLWWFLGVDTYLWLFHTTAVLVVGVSLLLTLVGYYNARRTPGTVHVQVPISNLPPALVGFRIAQISDIHVGPTIKREFLQRIIERVNTLDAHVVAITGDLVDGSVSELAEHTEGLRDLRSVYGSYFVTGNHEYYSGADAWIAELRRLGVNVLHNQHCVIQHDNSRLLLAGVSDYSGHHFGEHHRSDPHAALIGAPVHLPKVLLAHQPRSAAAAQKAGFDLQLSGHTHGGQFLPWNWFVPLQQPFTAGLNKLGNLWVYTSRGTGYWGPPKRLGAPAEITLISLVAA
ncbi:MAG: metallophosphoesterase [Pseudomonas marincola]|uniref:metallophosphoesterase n=1 Tax=Pseudomonas marincola TaxID=437900 RepID=UPI00300195E0